jgi:hypothetical protein
LRQFSPEVADEYERVQERHRAGRVPFAIHPRDGTRITLDYGQPPELEGQSGEGIEYDLDGRRRIRLHESIRAGDLHYAVRLTAPMREELLVRSLAFIDPPGPEPESPRRHDTYRFIACRMCPRCFKGPLLEDEVSVAIYSQIILLFKLFPSSLTLTHLATWF